MEKNDQILDQFEEEESRMWYHHWLLVYGPIGLFCVGLIFRIQHWPASRLILIMAMALIIFRSVVFFLSSKRRWWEWTYFLSRIFLMVVLIDMFGLALFGSEAIIYALALVFVCLIVVLYKSKREKIPQQEKIEDDY